MENTNVNFNEIVENEDVKNEILEEMREGQYKINVPEETPKKKGLIAKLKELKWWQKALLLAGGATLIYVGGKWIFKSNQTPEIQKVKVVVPMDQNNEIDQKVQELVNTLAEGTKESVEETAPF